MARVCPVDHTHQLFPSPPRTTEPPHLHIVSRAQREANKSKYMHPQFSATTRLALRGGDEVLYFRSRAVLGLPVSTTSYSRHVFSNVQTRSTGPDNEWSLTDTDRANLFPARSQLSFPLLHKPIFHLSINTVIEPECPIFR